MNNNGNNDNGNNPRHNHDNQIVLTSRVRETLSGRESLNFDINLALFKISVVAMIPYEDEAEAPVYLHFKLRPRVPRDAQPARPNDMNPGERRRFRTRRTED